MSTSERLFLTMLISGILVLLASLTLARLHWRPDIARYGRRAQVLQVLLHPEQYTVNAFLRAIRSLSTTGALLLAGAAILLVFELVRRTMSG